jgi:hypothetical protein
MVVFLVGAVLLIFVLASPNGLETLSEVIRRGTGLRWFDDVESSSVERAVLIRAALLGLTIYFAAWWASPCLVDIELGISLILLAER